MNGRKCGPSGHDLRLNCDQLRHQRLNRSVIQLLALEHSNRIDLLTLRVGAFRGLRASLTVFGDHRLPVKAVSLPLIKEATPNRHRYEENDGASRSTLSVAVSTGLRFLKSEGSGSAQ